MALLTASVLTSDARFSRIASLGPHTARTKAWLVTVNHDEQVDIRTFEVNLTDTVGTTASGKIAPGSTGSFGFVIDCTQCETDVTWSINFAYRDPTMIVDQEEVERPYPPIDFLCVVKDADNNDMFSRRYLRMGETEFNGNFTYSPATQSKQIVDITIGWTWPINPRVNDTQYADEEYVYLVTITAEQTL